MPCSICRENDHNASRCRSVVITTAFNYARRLVLCVDEPFRLASMKQFIDLNRSKHALWIKVHEMARADPQLSAYVYPNDELNILIIPERNQTIAMKSNAFRDKVYSNIRQQCRNHNMFFLDMPEIIDREQRRQREQQRLLRRRQQRLLQRQQAMISQNPKRIINLQMITLDAVHYSEETCSICMEDLTPQNTIATNCKHVFCTSCTPTFLKRSSLCPLCRVSIDTLCFTKDIGMDNFNQLSRALP